MSHQMTFACLACQTCQAKIHCDRCGEEIVESLLRLDGVDRAEVNMVARSILVEGSIDADDLEIELEDLGLLVD